MRISAKELIKNSTYTSSKLRIYYETLRLKEVFLIGGVTFIGILFNPQVFSSSVLPDWVLIMLSSYTLLAHAFASNDWSGYEYDKLDINKVYRPLIKGEISIDHIKIIAISLLIISTGLAYIVTPVSSLIVLVIALLNYLYSGRKIFLKSVPLVSTLIHSLGASLGFMLGYTYTGLLDLSGVYFSFYFGLLYAAGHLNHEVMDNDSDIKSEIPTTPTRLGKRKALISSFILFSFSFIYIVYLVLIKLLPIEIISGVVVSYFFYTYFFRTTMKSPLDYKSMIWFRRKYRIIFLIWGMFLSFNIIFNK